MGHQLSSPELRGVGRPHSPYLHTNTFHQLHGGLCHATPSSHPSRHTQGKQELWTLLLKAGKKVQQLSTWNKRTGIYSTRIIYLSIQLYVYLEYNTGVIHHFFPPVKLTGCDTYLLSAGSSVGTVLGARTHIHTHPSSEFTRQRVSRSPQILPVAGMLHQDL